MPQADGFYLVNCTQDGSPSRSGIAYYADMFANDNNRNEQPKEFVETAVNGNTTWEQGKDCSADFPSSGFTFTWNIEVNAQSTFEGTIVGKATATKGSETFTIFKDNGRNLVTLPDGYTCISLYLCQLRRS